jgi:hypothetical protein
MQRVRFSVAPPVASTTRRPRNELAAVLGLVVVGHGATAVQGGQATAAAEHPDYWIERALGHRLVSVASRLPPVLLLHSFNT